jgi:ABC-type branched-subunit amino acid transport system substrate-binding protein
VTILYNRAPVAGRITAWAGVIAVACCALSATATELNETQQRGKQIYFEGASPRGSEITAVVGDEAAMLPGSAMPCSSCHGSDGLGRPEGGVTPLDIRWSELTKTYGHVHHDGRKHPAFDDDSFIRSMIAGIDPANNPMDRSMPMYQMSGEDMADLVAYMKVLEFDLDPGVTEDTVTVATLLPLSGGGNDTGEAMRKVLDGYFADINEQGGVFGRRIELLAVPMGQTAAASLDTLREALDSEGILALVGAFTVGIDEALLTLLRSDNVPLVGPFTLDPGDAYFDAAAFYLYAGFDDQVRVLADRAMADGAAGDKILIAGPDGDRSGKLLQAARDQVRGKGARTAPEIVSYPTGGFDAKALARSIADQEAEAVIFVGTQPEFDAMIAELRNQVPVPRIYLLSSLMSRPLVDLPVLFDERVFLAYPTLSSDISARGREEYGRLAEKYELPQGHIQAQMASLAAAKLFVEGLRRAGRDLSRVRLTEGLEKLYEFETGVTPPLSYGPNRRIGARGAHIVTVDLDAKTYRPVGASWYAVQ